MFLFPGESSKPRDWTQVSCIAGRFLTIWATRALINICKILWYTLYINPHTLLSGHPDICFNQPGCHFFLSILLRGPGICCQNFPESSGQTYNSASISIAFPKLPGITKPSSIPNTPLLALSSWQSFSHPCFFFFKEGRNICLLSRLCMACRSSWQREQVIS